MPLRKSLFFILGTILLSSPVPAQWTTPPVNPLLVDNVWFHFDPEIQCANGQYVITWSYSNASKRKLVAYDFQGFRQWSSGDPYVTRDAVVTNNSVGWQDLWTDNKSNSILADLVKNQMSNRTYVMVGKNSSTGLNIWSTGNLLFRSDCNAENFWLAVGEKDNIFLAIKWIEKPSNKTDLSLYEIREDGTLAWEYRQFLYADSTVYIDPDISLLPDPKGGCFILYETTNQIPYGGGSTFIDSDFRMNKVDASGLKLWEADKVILHQTGKFFFPAAILGEDGYLYCLWGVGNLIKLHPDGSVVWETEVINLNFNFWVKNLQKLEFSQEGNIRVFYHIRNWNRLGIIGQEITPDGVLNWGEDGTHLVDIPSSPFGGRFHMASYRDTSLISYDDADPADTTIYKTNLVLIDHFGRNIWNEPKVLFRQKDHTCALAGIASGFNRQFVIAWNQWSGGSDKLYAQNIFTDGTMGVKTSFSEVLEAPTGYFRGLDPSAQTILFEPNPSPASFRLVNLFGQVMVSGLAMNAVGVAHLVPGIYILTIYKESKILETRKILIQ